MIEHQAQGEIAFNTQANGTVSCQNAMGLVFFLEAPAPLPAQPHGPTPQAAVPAQRPTPLAPARAWETPVTANEPTHWQKKADEPRGWLKRLTGGR